jgi:hypothetical protein
MAPAEYESRLRTIIAYVRAGSPSVPVRLVQIQPLPTLLGIRQALRDVGSDPGNKLIDTDDLSPDAVDSPHFVTSAYAVVLARIAASL